MRATSDALVFTDMHAADSDLRFIKVTKHYDDFTLHEVTFDVPRGSVVGLVGRNGAGKTTLMKAIFSIIGLDGGSVEVFGSNAAQLTEKQRIDLRQQVGFVGAVMSFPVGMTISEVAHMYELSYPAFSMKSFQELCSLMELRATHKTIKDLSRGMGMKLQLACVLASGAKLLVLDEPTAGLDPLVRYEVLDILRSWIEGEGRSMLISSHITSDLERLADYLVMVENGRMMLACKRAQVSEMGVLRLDAQMLEHTLDRISLFSGQMRVLRRADIAEVLVPNRFELAQAYPDLALEAVSIDDMMTFVAKGEVR